MAQDPNQIRVLQWNCRSIRRKLPEIPQIAKDFKVIILSETWLNMNDKFYIKGFDVVRKDRLNNVGGGVAILVSNSLKYKRISNLLTCKDSIEACAIKIFLADSLLTVVSCYRPPNNSVNEASWMRFLNQFDGKFIIAGDFNAHHPLWGDRTRCDEGKKLFNAIERSEVELLNQGQNTYYSRQYGTESAIDLAFIDSASLASYNWSVGQDSWGSDHFPIYITLNEKVEIKTSFKSNRITNSKTDWNLVDENLANCIEKCKEVIYNIVSDIQTKYTTFIAIVTNCVQEANPNPDNRFKNKKKIIIKNPIRPLGGTVSARD